MIQEFIKQNGIDDVLMYDSGFLYEDKKDGFIITGQQYGAEETFSVSQPVYDCDHNKLGYLGIGCFDSLDYTHNPHEERIPVYYWKICNPTKYCRNGVKVYTYWQNFNETKKEERREKEV